MRLKVELPIYGEPNKTLALRTETAPASHTALVMIMTPKGETFSVRAADLLRAAKVLVE